MPVYGKWYRYRYQYGTYRYLSHRTGTVGTYGTYRSFAKSQIQSPKCLVGVGLLDQDSNRYGIYGTACANLDPKH